MHKIKPFSPPREFVVAFCAGHIFASKRETISLKLVLLLDNHLQNQRHLILNLGGAFLNHNRQKCESDGKRERESESGANTQLRKITGWYLNLEFAWRLG